MESMACDFYPESARIFCREPDHIRRLSEYFRRRPEEFRSSQENQNTTSSLVLSLLKSEVSRKVQSFTWTFLFLRWFEFILLYTFFEIESVKAVIAQIFPLSVRNW